VTIDGISLFGQFLSAGLLDDRISQLDIKYTQSGLDSSVAIRTSAFSKSLVVDPNYAVLIDTTNTLCNQASNNNFTATIAIAVVCSVVVVGLVGLGVVLHPKIKNWWKTKKFMDIQMDTVSSTISTDSHDEPQVRTSVGVSVDSE